MTIPYTVQITGTKQDVNISISPQPVAVSEEYLPVVSKRFQGIILEHSNTKALTLFAKGKLKSALIEALTDFHKQGIIKPKED